MEHDQADGKRRNNVSGWFRRQRWVGVALVLLFTGLAPAPPQLPPRPPDEFQQADDDPLSSGFMPSQPPDKAV